MSARVDPHAAPHVAEEAARWDARLRSPECTDAERARFAAWREVDPARARAYDALQGAITDLAGAADDHPTLQGYRDAAFAKMRARSTARPRWAAAGVAMAASLAVAALVYAGVEGGVFDTSSDGQYVTALGERSTFTLDDGSVVTLNTSSRLVVDYTAETRAVALEEGQALFEVAKNPDRPFVVTAGAKAITALGTAFDVRLDAQAVTVTMVEGRVAVDDGDQELVAGEQLVAAAETVVRAADAERVTSWREGRVVFEDTALADAVAEMNRYAETKLVVDDPRVGSLRVNGLFRTGETDAFLRALVNYFPVRAQWTDDDRVILAWTEAP